MAQNMKDIGKMICRKAMEVKYGVMEHNIQVPIRRVKSTTMEFIYGLTSLSMRATGMRTK